MSRRVSQLIRRGWITDQHGSWPMGFVPLAVGLVIARNLEWRHILVVCAWTTGFMFFAVAEKWLKFNYRAKYRPALLTYAAASAFFCLAAAASAPYLMWWVVPFAPLIAVSFVSAKARKERQLPARLVAIAAGALVLAVVDNVGTGLPWYQLGAVSGKAWLFTALLGIYFASTVPVVKTVIRERHSQGWFIGSVITHAVVLAGMAIAAAVGWQTWWQVAVWAVALAKAFYLPWSMRTQGRVYRPSQLGAVECMFTAAIVATLPWGLSVG